jgi:1-phosphatidylinositol-3-phosphate 5-kinase
MKDHIRRFCHSTGSITMFIQELSAPISPKSSDDEIVLWKFCTVCKNITPISPLSPSAWMYSFAMFLMMLFYEGGMTGHSESEDAVAAAPCLHSIHQQHLTCFAKRNIVATFRFDSITPFGLGLPPSRIEIPARVGLPEDQMRDECKSLNIQGPSIFSAIFEELIKFKPDFGLGTFEEIVKELLDEHESDFEKYRSLLRHLNGQTDEVTRSLDDSLFASKKYLSDSVSKWRGRLESLHELKKKEERVLRSERSRTSASVSSSTSDSVDWKARKMEDWMALVPSNLEAILPPPFPSNLHFSISSGQSMVVDEKQPSSLVAYTLASGQKLNIFVCV